MVASQERNAVSALLALVVTLLLVLVLNRKPKKPDIERMQAKSYASSVLKENKEVFEKLSEM
jgi:hypothetical protein